MTNKEKEGKPSDKNDDRENNGLNRLVVEETNEKETVIENKRCPTVSKFDL